MYTYYKYDLLIKPAPSYFMPLDWNYYYYYYTAGVSSSINKNMDEVHSDIPMSTQRKEFTKEHKRWEKKRMRLNDFQWELFFF